MKPDKLKMKSLAEISNRLSEKGFGTSTSGNCSVRDGNFIYLTPTGVSLSDINIDNISVSDINGNRLEGPKPTKEKELHLTVYRRLESALCILHVHPVNSIALSIKLSGRNIFLTPSATPQFVMRCGQVPVIPYAHPGSGELVNFMEEAVSDNSFSGKAVIMVNHGVMTFGESPKHAMNSLEELEENSRIVLGAGIEEQMLTDKQVRELLERKM